MDVEAKAMRKIMKVIMESAYAMPMENMDMAMEKHMMVFFRPK